MSGQRDSTFAGVSIRALSLQKLAPDSAFTVSPMVDASAIAVEVGGMELTCKVTLTSVLFREMTGESLFLLVLQCNVQLDYDYCGRHLTHCLLSCMRVCMFENQTSYAKFASPTKFAHLFIQTSFAAGMATSYLSHQRY
jgi:hypothetical protein